MLKSRKIVGFRFRGCLYGGRPALLVGLALFAEIPRLS